MLDWEKKMEIIFGIDIYWANNIDLYQVKIEEHFSGINKYIFMYNNNDNIISLMIWWIIILILLAMINKKNVICILHMYSLQFDFWNSINEKCSLFYYYR